MTYPLFQALVSRAHLSVMDISTGVQDHLIADDFNLAGLEGVLEVEPGVLCQRGKGPAAQETCR